MILQLRSCWPLKLPFSICTNSSNPGWSFKISNFPFPRIFVVAGQTGSPLSPHSSEALLNGSKKDTLRPYALMTQNMSQKIFFNVSKPWFYCEITCEWGSFNKWCELCGKMQFINYWRLRKDYSVSNLYPVSLRGTWQTIESSSQSRARIGVWYLVEIEQRSSFRRTCDWLETSVISMLAKIKGILFFFRQFCKSLGSAKSENDVSFVIWGKIGHLIFIFFSKMSLINKERVACRVGHENRTSGSLGLTLNFKKSSKVQNSRKKSGENESSFIVNPNFGPFGIFKNRGLILESLAFDFCDLSDELFHIIHTKSKKKMKITCLIFSVLK